ncbi:hypothetical protein V6B33_06740 [Mangrovibacillus sp. Mu-81]
MKNRIAFAIEKSGVDVHSIDSTLKSNNSINRIQLLIVVEDEDSCGKSS